jgi:hypothetical protein
MPRPCFSISTGSARGVDQQAAAVLRFARRHFFHSSVPLHFQCAIKDEVALLGTGDMVVGAAPIRMAR